MTEAELKIFIEKQIAFAVMKAKAELYVTLFPNLSNFGLSDKKITMQSLAFALQDGKYEEILKGDIVKNGYRLDEQFAAKGYNNAFRR